MADFIRALRISVYNLRRTISSIRILTVLLIIACFITQNLQAVLEISDFVKIGITPYSFPHLVNDYVCQLVMMAGAVILFCNAPFEDDGYFYMLPRAGKRSWALGQVIYIVSASFLYVMFLLLMSILPLIGHMEFGSEWGKIWGTLAKTDAGVQFGLLFSVTEYMISNYSPIFALAVSVLLEWCCVSWLGLMIYFLNKLTGKAVGTCVGAFFVLLDICISNDWMPWANRFSPITLAQINAYAGYNLKYHITFQYGIAFFIIGIFVLSVLSILVNYREKAENWLQKLEVKWIQKQR